LATGFRLQVSGISRPPLPGASVKVFKVGVDWVICSRQRQRARRFGC
jgi:hypothetical protein